MKIILSLALIAVGLYGLFKENKRRTKEKKEIMERVIANHLIAKDALERLSLTKEIKIEDYFDGMGKLVDNSIEIIFKACGANYVEKADWLIKGYEKEVEK